MKNWNFFWINSLVYFQPMLWRYLKHVGLKIHHMLKKSCLFWPNSSLAVTLQNDLCHVSFPFFSPLNQKACQHGVHAWLYPWTPVGAHAASTPPAWGKVTKLPSVSFFLPAMKKLSKNPEKLKGIDWQYLQNFHQYSEGIFIPVNQ